MIFVIFCKNNQEKEIITYKNYERPRESIPRAEIEEIKACNIKLDACILNCKKEYPSLSVRYSDWGTCKDRCINKFIGTDCCSIHYESFRSSKHKLWYGK